MLIGALEAGGTKMVCALGREDGTIIEQVSIPTTTPEETIPKITAYFKDKGIEALGIGAVEVFIHLLTVGTDAADTAVIEGI